MTPLILDTEASEINWRRKCRDAVNAIAKRLTGDGSTAQRPPGPVVGQQYYDKTLGIPIWWNGSAWKDAAGITV